MARADIHAFHGYVVVENDKGNLSIMAPSGRSVSSGQRLYTREGDFADRRQLADYCHGKMIGWQNR